MKLADDWRDVLRYAWSIRFMVLAVVFTLLEYLWPLMDGAVHPLPFRLLSAVFLLAGLFSRVVAQEKLK